MLSKTLLPVVFPCIGIDRGRTPTRGGISAGRVLDARVGKGEITGVLVRVPVATVSPGLVVPSTVSGRGTPSHHQYRSHQKLR